MQTRTIFWQAITPVHPGTEQSGSSVIDLPVAREAATKFPVIPASSLKGVLRDGREDEAANKTYGSKNSMGELTLTDARLLLLPVRSYAGTFALITCPLVLQRLQRDAQALDKSLNLEIPSVEGEKTLAGSAIRQGDKVILEDIDLAVVTGQTDQLAEALSQAMFGKAEPYFLERFALVSNDVFSYFCETGMEVIARVKINADTKTVDKETGALWYEEAIPAEAVFSSFALSVSDDFSELKRRYIQIGGKASVGRGLLRLLVVS